MPSYTRLLAHALADPVILHLPTPLAICNPSLVVTPSATRALVRALDPQPWRGPASAFVSSESWLIELSQDFQTLATRRVDDSAVRMAVPAARHGLEDGRLFCWRAAWWVLYSGLERSATGYANTMLLARLEEERLVEPLLLPSPVGQIREKNWMPWVRPGLDGREELLFVHGAEPLRSFRLTEDGVLQPATTGASLPRARAVMVSGSSTLLPWHWDASIGAPGDHRVPPADQRYLAVVHRRRKLPGWQRLWLKHVRRDPDYAMHKVHIAHQFVLLDGLGQLRALSTEFVFEIDGVEFCAGIAEQRDALWLSYGVLDRQARLMALPCRTVQAMLRPVS